MNDQPCVFCGIIAGTEPADIRDVWSDAVAFRPLNPVTLGHTLIVPRTHVPDAISDPEVTGVVMRRAAQYADGGTACNILTSVGAAATQSVFHLHVHVIPRVSGDGLMVPWGTTGDPHAPHRCPGMDRLETELTALRTRTLRPGMRCARW